MRSDGNIFKIKGFCFKVMYLMTYQILSSTFKFNFVLTKTLAYAPLKVQATNLHDFRAMSFCMNIRMILFVDLTADHCIPDYRATELLYQFCTRITKVTIHGTICLFCHYKASDNQCKFFLKLQFSFIVYRIPYMYIQKTFQYRLVFSNRVSIIIVYRV